ncbi:hypothetical protein [Candidatus Sodalis endolongispinus]|uniref:hypothetical protein n=1 Tax=Candidatus Sodalis endolongispinus TaxID=2812662 RepID=UPI001FE8B90B|nr:hypothetical protein [Candidatus Sodalis endolongispinus]
MAAIQEPLPFEVQWLTTASHAADPAVLLMRSVIGRQLEQWIDAQRDGPAGRAVN